MLLLISDTNVLIDIEAGELTSSLFSMKGTTFAVPDVLFEKELSQRHPHLLDFGLQVKSLSSKFVAKTTTFARQYRNVSRIDLFALGLALQEKCPLLTGDSHLRKVAVQEGVDVHGTLWIVKKMVEEKVIQPMIARAAFQKMKNAASRLPWTEVEKMLKKF